VKPILRAFRRAVRDRQGAVALEFGLLAPLFIALMLAVFQVAIALQSYNALRNVSADAARFAMVQFQTGNDLTNSQILDYATTRATGPLYQLNLDSLDAAVADAAVQRVAGAREMQLTISYEIPTVLDLFGWTSPTLRYARPIFVVPI